MPDQTTQTEPNAPAHAAQTTTPDPIDAALASLDGIDDGDVDAQSSDRARDDKGRFVSPKADEAAGEASDEPPAGPGEKPDAEEIPPHLRAAAQYAGEDVDALVNDIGHERAVAWLEKVHRDRNALTQRLAAIGRSALGQQNGTGQAPPVPPQQPPNGHGFNGFAGNGQFVHPAPMPPGQTADPYGLPTREDFVNLGYPEEAYDRMVVPQQRLASELRQVRELLAQQERMRAEAIAQENTRTIDAYFSGLKGFEDVYGTGDINNITRAQHEARSGVVAQAELILAGAAHTGQSITPAQALAMAHDVVSAPHAHEQARRQVQASAQQRRGVMTVRPTVGSAPTASSPRAAAMAAAAEQDRKMGGAAFFTD